MRMRDDVSPQFYRCFDLFDGLNDAQFAELVEFVEYHIYEPGERIVEEGECSRDMYLLADGRIDIIKSDEQHEAVRLAVLEPEAILGELGLILGEPRSATAVADEEAHLLHISGDPLLERRRNDDIVAYKIEHNVLRSLARRQATLNTRLMKALRNASEETVQAPDTAGEFERDEITDLRHKLDDQWSF